MALWLVCWTPDQDVWVQVLAGSLCCVLGLDTLLSWWLSSPRSSVIAKGRLQAAGKIHRLKKQRSPAGFLAGDESVKHKGHFTPSLSRLNVIFSWQLNFLATTLPRSINGYQQTVRESWQNAGGWGAGVPAVD